ncbi:hypothetical protein [Marinobacter zhejiangensis]|uniref:Uncharacterized protein n=1 Tax=Marinobacter zhejiangensis TaxID=488535 RepID=A0A1I4NKX8_9GAMM|nr:hypothetical protein [Marinobacter zhejiangensis]SFM16148.1 hypothetical protein SAMN04487963_1470 [Marinobacter zhejiangensis]
MQDLELYIRDLEPGQLVQWLSQHLDGLDLDDSGAGVAAFKGTGYFKHAKVRVSVYPQANGKRYTCVVLEGEELPWSQDLECARSAWRTLDNEVRCSPGGWKEGDSLEEDKWWRIDQRGEMLVVWS